MPGTPVIHILFLICINVSQPKFYFWRCIEWLRHVSLLQAVERFTLYLLRLKKKNAYGKLFGANYIN